MSRRDYRNVRSRRWIGILLIFIAVGIIMQYLIPILFAVGIGYGIYYYATHQPKKITGPSASQQIEDLKKEIRAADSRIKQLDNYLKEKSYANYQQLADQLLPQLSYIQGRANTLKKYISPEIYQRIQRKVQNVTTDIHEQLHNLHAQTSESLKPNLEELAPELLETIHNIQIDHEAILKKISQSESNNKEELTAIHQSQMEHYEDILEGYLKIKTSPKDFYNAEERLSSAKAAIEQFDLDLDETLRQLNEADLRDFDISLRILSKKEPNTEL